MKKKILNTVLSIIVSAIFMYPAYNSSSLKVSSVRPVLVKRQLD